MRGSSQWRRRTTPPPPFSSCPPPEPNATAGGGAGAPAPGQPDAPESPRTLNAAQSSPRSAQLPDVRHQEAFVEEREEPEAEIDPVHRLVFRPPEVVRVEVEREHGVEGGARREARHVGLPHVRLNDDVEGAPYRHVEVAVGQL